MAHSRMPERPHRDWLREAPVAVLLYVLLWEWLRPLTQLSALTDIYWLQPILIAIGAFVLLDYSRCPQALSWALKLGVCLLVVVHYHYPNAWWHMDGWASFALDFAADIERTWSGRWSEIGSESRTLLFLVGWAMLVYALYTLMIFKQTAFWFVGATIAYLLAFQVLSGIDTTMALLRTAGLGLGLLAVLRVPWLERRFHAPSGSGSGGMKGLPFAWLVTSAVVVALLLAVGWFGVMNHGRGHAEALVWQEPRLGSWLLERWGALSGDTASAAGRTGYDFDDTRLGGGLQEDRSVAFTAVTERLTYWRGEAKTVYTGKGWVGTPAAEAPAALEREAPEFVQEIWLENASLGGILFAGGRIVDVLTLETSEGEAIPAAALRRDAAGGKVSLASDWRAAHYRLGVGGSFAEPPDERELAAYRQLPRQYDERVLRLAAELTRDARSDKDKAEAIAAHLSSSQYRYDLGTSPPPADEDFVAHFLFDTQVGYCDHFSSAMVVLLRAAGVPARWVKGFATGEITQSPKEGSALWEVTVRNSDAHSWVEAYLPEQGWTLYEPTPGFSEDAASQGIVVAAGGAGVQPASAAAVGPERSTTHTAGPLAVLGEWVTEAYRNARWQSWSAAVRERLMSGELWAAVGSAVAIAGAAYGAGKAASAIRRRRAASVVPGAVRHEAAATDPYARRLNRCWRNVYRLYGPKPPGLTYREYAASLPLEAGRRQALQELVERHETYTFGGERSRRLTDAQLRSLWKRIKRG